MADLSNLKFTSNEIAVIKSHCMDMAKILKKEDDLDLTEMAVHSKDFQHRIAAAWYYGLVLKHDDCLLRLIVDEHPLVSLAARESCCAIASKVYDSKNVDFGPVINSNMESKIEAKLMWGTYLEKKSAKQKTKQEKSQRTVHEILNLPSSNKGKP